MSCCTSSVYDSNLILNTKEFDYVVNKLRTFFKSKGFLEVHTQNRLSILAACEDPFTIRTFDYLNQKFPLPQTGQMWLEYELLKNPEPNGYFCVSTSYRHEPNPVEGRHMLIFPMFEFEMKGGMEKMIKLEEELLEFLGYKPERFMRGKYLDVVNEFYSEGDEIELTNDDEMRLYKQYSETFFLTDFPEYTSPFWNMRRSLSLNSDENKFLSLNSDKILSSEEGNFSSLTETANKVDVILSGHETIGSAEREIDKDIMRQRFMTIMDGKYKDKIFELFGEERVLRELEDFLKFNFFERSGGGIGISRLINSMKREKLMFQ